MKGEFQFGAQHTMERLEHRRHGDEWCIWRFLFCTAASEQPTGLSTHIATGCYRLYSCCCSVVVRTTICMVDIVSFAILVAM
eukprot:2819601-Prymnesium_polylepis.1